MCTLLLLWLTTVSNIQLNMKAFTAWKYSLCHSSLILIIIRYNSNGEAITLHHRCHTGIWVHSSLLQALCRLPLSLSMSFSYDFLCLCIQISSGHISLSCICLKQYVLKRHPAWISLILPAAIIFDCFMKTWIFFFCVLLGACFIAFICTFINLFLPISFVIHLQAPLACSPAMTESSTLLCGWTSLHFLSISSRTRSHQASWSPCLEKKTSNHHLVWPEEPTVLRC